MKLHVIKGETPGRELVIDKTEFTIGREVDNDFVISEVGVSRRHCRLSLVGEEWLVEDCHSVNGVLVNGQRVDGGMILKAGDEITVFSHVFRFLPKDAKAEDFAPLVVKSAADAPATAENNEQTAAGIAKPPLPENVEAGSSQQSSGNRAAIIVKLLVLAVLLIMVAILAAKLMRPMKTTTDEKSLAVEIDGEQVADNARSATSATSENDEADGALLPDQTVAELTAPKVRYAPAAAADDDAEDDGAQGQVTITPMQVSPTTTATVAPVQRQPVTPITRSAAPAQVSVVVRSEPPGAEVFIDRTSYGTTPAVVADISPGRHLLELEMAGYESVSRQVQVPDDISRQAFAMHLRAGTLLVKSTPSGAAVWQGRQLYGVTPLLLTSLPEGQYDLTIQGPGCEPYKLTAAVSRARGQVIEAELKSVLGNIAVTSRPPGCRVYLDGMLKGMTSADRGELLLTDLAAGPATMKVEHPSGVFVSGTININKGQTLERNATIWVPTHRLTLIDGKKVTGLLMDVNEHGDVVLEDRARRVERYLKPQITNMTTLSNEEITQYFSESDKDRESDKTATTGAAELARNDDFDMSLPEMLQELRRLTIQDFNEMYKGKQILLRGHTTLRQQPKGDKTPGNVYFGQPVCARMALGTAAEDWEYLSQAARNNAPVAVRGICDGIKDKAVILDNCTIVK